MRRLQLGKDLGGLRNKAAMCGTTGVDNFSDGRGRYMELTLGT